MALDGIFLHCIKNELIPLLIGSKVDKIYQPSRDELLFCMRTKINSFKLLFCARANSPRIHITEHTLENPAVPPMLCMLFRKKLIGAKLLNIRQINLERALYFDFDTINELGDKEILTVAIEIMGNCSNIVLIAQNMKIIDSLKRVSLDISSKRQVLPGLKYDLPPSQSKLCLLTCPLNDIVSLVLKNYTDNLGDAILQSVQGMAPVVCQEIANNIIKSSHYTETNAVYLHAGALCDAFKEIKENINSNNFTPYMVLSSTASPSEFSFIKINSIANAQNILYKSFSQLLDDFYFKKDSFERIKVKSSNFVKTLKNAQSRLRKKIKAQEKELLNCNQKENFKICGDLLTTNIYKIKNGDKSVSVENFYSPGNNFLEIALDPRLTATQNAQKYYKKYKKAKTAETFLNVEIDKAKSELSYIDAVLYETYSATTDAELNEIEQELLKAGYIKKTRKAKKNEKTFLLKFISNDGFIILVGKNNLQNDELTFKKAHKNDIWLHAKDVPGSHTIIHTEKKEVSNETLLLAANLAAFFSKSKESPKVEVDYTYVKNVKKMPNSRPGMVTYSNFSTLFVRPDANLVKNLRFLD